ncbi:MAG: glycine--tRNA ligase subunit beta [Rhodospirillaceae bacterium]|nr:glycine--tRNA ligase subunit beta [Rhodospirillaceae bacterium]|tara:strand:+ start:1618 stop:3732 length:2115 start_codon:yes stop_codon:yes gene_type:complete
MAQFLLELRSEEIPARMQGSGAEALRNLVCEELEKSALKFDCAHSYYTFSRLVVVVEGLPNKQPDLSEEKRGPRTDASEAAIKGFLRSNDLCLDDCEKRSVGNGEFWFATRERKGQKTSDILSDFLPKIIRKMPWKKSMRWGESSLRWVRPLKSILCVLEGEVIHVDVGDDIPCCNNTYGHRFHAPEPISVGFFDDYEKSLQRAKVVLKAQTRRELITEKASKLAVGLGLCVKSDPELLDEIVGLVEWPVPMIGRIDNHFLNLPEEVLITSMRSHQKYFALEDSTGRLAPYFILVSNISPSDGGCSVVTGNERVLRARLADAKFFWDQDRKKKLEEFLPGLDGMVFHEKLGTLANKVSRIQGLSSALALHINADVDHTYRAATLCKADLTTGMVGEFASLQGIVGRYYALRDGEAQEVADAVAQHYSPAGPKDYCPVAPVVLAISIADKLDTLVGFFIIDEKPTGSRDPYALRRAALGVIRMILENKLRLQLSDTISAARLQYEEHCNTGIFNDSKLEKSGTNISSDEMTNNLTAFFVERLKVYLRARGKRHDLIDSVFALNDEDDLVRIVSRVEALQEFLSGEDGKTLLAAYRRASNIVEIEEKREKETFDGRVDIKLLVEPAERKLFSVLNEMKSPFELALAKEDFTEAMTTMVALRDPIDNFFESVIVNTDKAPIRINRLKLLSRFRQVLNRVAIFRHIEG